MRIISGIAKGHKLAVPEIKNTSIRPTSDRAREALFNIIGDKIPDSSVLDLFSGTGSFGAEAISRGASHVSFVDHNKAALSLTYKNTELCCSSLEKAGLPVPTVSIFKHNLSKNLSFAKNSNRDLSHFDIIFLDPPYSKNISSRVLQLLDKEYLLSDGSCIIAEDRADQSPPQGLKNLDLYDSRRNGDTLFWFFTYHKP